MSFSFIPVAMAASDQALAGSQTANFVSTLLFVGSIFLIFYFMILRPQNKQQKMQQQLMANLKKDDEIVTSGGILGRITKLADQFVVIEVASGVEVVIQKQSITSVVPRGTMKSI